MTLETRGLHFSYNGRPVLAGLSLSLARGESVGILGVNGAGKSTLLRCLNRNLKPQKGAVLVEGRNLADLSGEEIARLLGYVPQNRFTDPLNVFDSVLLGRKPHIKWQASGRDLQVVAEVLAQMGLEKLAMRPVASLSGGEAQKVVIARALAQEPRMLLLDEPTSNLDLRNQLELMRLLGRVMKDKGIGAAVCLHDINLALRYMTRLVLLKEGGIKAILTPEQLSPELISEVYGVEVILAQVAGHRVVIPQEARGEPAEGGLDAKLDRETVGHDSN
ncbi:iron ABC transporter ATP-binding protein [Desulfocarbo indianensis]|nr:iron ABC transporter ATP-binding protein [Desulfocarbo indianensis]